MDAIHQAQVAHHKKFERENGAFIFHGGSRLYESGARLNGGGGVIPVWCPPHHDPHVRRSQQRNFYHLRLQAARYWVRVLAFHVEAKGPLNVTCSAHKQELATLLSLDEAKLPDPKELLGALRALVEYDEHHLQRLTKEMMAYVGPG